MHFSGFSVILQPSLKPCFCLCVCSAVLGKGEGAAQTPSVSRLVEAVVLELCRLHQHDAVVIAGVRVHCWGAVLRDYRQIQNNVLNCTSLLASTCIQLFGINQRTLFQW